MKTTMCEYCEEFKPTCRWYDKNGVEWIVCKDCLEDLKEYLLNREKNDV